jgi:hypothetical protein
MPSITKNVNIEHWRPQCWPPLEPQTDGIDTFFPFQEKGHMGRIGYWIFGSSVKDSIEA